MDAYVASLQAVHSSLAAKGDALNVVERKVLEAQVRPARLQTVEISIGCVVMKNTGHHRPQQPCVCSGPSQKCRAQAHLLSCLRAASTAAWTCVCLYKLLVTAYVPWAQRAAGVSAAKPLPAVAARALATGQGALEAISAQLQAAARAYIPLSHLLWGLWGLIQVPTAFAGRR